MKHLSSKKSSEMFTAAFASERLCADYWANSDINQHPDMQASSSKESRY